MSTPRTGGECRFGAGWKSKSSPGPAIDGHRELGGREPEVGRLAVELGSAPRPTAGRTGHWRSRRGRSWQRGGPSSSSARRRSRRRHRPARPAVPPARSSPVHRQPPPAHPRGTDCDAPRATACAVNRHPQTCIAPGGGGGDGGTVAWQRRSDDRHPAIGRDHPGRSRGRDRDAAALAAWPSRDQRAAGLGSHSARRQRASAVADPRSGLSVKKPSIPASRNVRISPTRSPTAFGSRCWTGTRPAGTGSPAGTSSRARRARRRCASRDDRGRAPAGAVGVARDHARPCTAPTPSA